MRLSLVSKGHRYNYFRINVTTAVDFYDAGGINVVIGYRQGAETIVYLYIDSVIH